MINESLVNMPFLETTATYLVINKTEHEKKKDQNPLAGLAFVHSNSEYGQENCTYKDFSLFISQSLKKVYLFLRGKEVYSFPVTIKNGYSQSN